MYCYIIPIFSLLGGRGTLPQPQIQSNNFIQKYWKNSTPTDPQTHTPHLAGLRVPGPYHAHTPSQSSRSAIMKKKTATVTKVIGTGETIPKCKHSRVKRNGSRWGSAGTRVAATELWTILGSSKFAAPLWRPLQRLSVLRGGTQPHGCTRPTRLP